MIEEDLVAERIAIESYSEMIRWLGSDDPTTRRMLEGILAMEEEHADDLANLLETLAANQRPKSKRSPSRKPQSRKPQSPRPRRAATRRK
jgi:bacterioferritin